MPKTRKKANAAKHKANVRRVPVVAVVKIEKVMVE